MPVKGPVKLLQIFKGIVHEIIWASTVTTLNLPHIFDRFYRVDKSRARAQGGSGLGLSIAQWIAQAHGGAIHVKSQVGEGTTFKVTLPRYKRTVDSPEEDLEKTRPSLRALGANLRR